MGIKKQEFYEGAALHVIARSGCVDSIRYEAPFFKLNGTTLALLKYCTKGRSPWPFTFTVEEQDLLKEKSSESDVVIGLVCGADGIAAISYQAYLTIASRRPSGVWISCFRLHGKHYEVSGPDGVLANKVAPSKWQGILRRRGCNEAHRPDSEPATETDREQE